jgi:transcriptional regulator with XRE-family HTH domain
VLSENVTHIKHYLIFVKGYFMNIGQRVKELRESKGIKATFMAKNVGLSPAMVSMIEREKCNVTVPQLILLSDFFGVSIDYLVKGANDAHA